MGEEMFSKIKEGNIALGNGQMQYVVFGQGTRPLVIIPGLSDGIRTVKGTGHLLKYFYHKFTKEFQVWVFSRKNELTPNMTTREMAQDQALAMNELNLKNACIMGISQGGMIAQWLAIDHPQKVDKLVLVVTLSRQNSTIQKVVGHWIRLAEQENYGELTIDTLQKNYSENKIKKWRYFFWLVKRTGKPVSKERFLIQAHSCINHDAYQELNKIKCPTLIIGGEKDKIIGDSKIQQEMADAIPNSKLIIYPELGHDAYTEKDFFTNVLDFLKDDSKDPSQNPMKTNTSSQ